MLTLPRNDQRLSIVGHTGSGKTWFAAWVLSKQRLDLQPWIVIDYKRDKLLNSIPKARELRMKDKVPSSPGLYLIHPHPSDEDGIEEFLWKVWEKGNTGVYTDEAHMLPNHDGALKALLTQGRSKRIPMITITQRPRWASRFVFSEADYHAAFPLVYPDDRKFMNGLFQQDIARLPRFHSAYHQVSENENFLLKPVPDGNTIIANIEAQLKPKTLFV